MLGKQVKISESNLVMNCVHRMVGSCWEIVWNSIRHPLTALIRLEIERELIIDVLYYMKGTGYVR